MVNISDLTLYISLKKTLILKLQKMTNYQRTMVSLAVLDISIFPQSECFWVVDYW